MTKIKFFDNIRSKISELKSKNKKVFFMCTVLFVVLIFLVISIVFSFGKKSTKQQKETTNLSVSDYAANIEKKLTEMILKLDSVKDASVFLMIDSTPKVEYLTEKNEEIKEDGSVKNSVLSETVVFEKNGSVTTPIVVTTVMPKITGVLIVTNKISVSTKVAIISSIGIVLNIDPSCISLLQEG